MSKIMRGASVALAAATAVALVVTSASAAPPRGETRRVSVSTGGAQASADSRGGSISGDGRFVVFESDADNLVPGDTNGLTDVFLRDLRRGTTERVSLRDDGGQYTLAHDAEISADGRYVVFQGGTGSPENGDWFSGAFLWDRVRDRTEVVSLTDDDKPASVTGDVRISRDGRYMAYVSSLADHGDTGTRMGAGVYLRDREKGTTRLVSLTEPPPTGDRYSWILGSLRMSADGSRVGYAMNQAKPGLHGAVHTWDRRTGRTERFDRDDRRTGLPTFSGDGRYAAFSSAAGLVPGDTNGVDDVFVRDLRTGATRRVSLGADGGQLDSRSHDPVIGEDGRHVVFVSGATTLVPGDTHHGPLFQRDLRTGVTQRVSVAKGGGEGDSQSAWHIGVSRDGRAVAFDSWAANLVPDDTNDTRDVFVRRLS